MLDQQKLIFIVGNSRSGTTLAARLLGKHSQIHAFREIHFFEQQVNSEAIRQRPPWPEQRRLELVERLLTTARDGYFSKTIRGKYRDDAIRILKSTTKSDPVSAYESFLNFETELHGKQIPCEQTPRNLYFLTEILDRFPNAYAINIIRDPRDVLLSQKNKWRRHFLGAKSIPLKEALRAWVNYHPYTISRLWLAAVRAAHQFDGHSRFLSVRFEDLLQDSEQTIQSLCGFVGVPFEPTMRDVPHVGSSVRMDEPDRIGIDAGRAGAWRQGGLTDIELSICQRIAETEMSRLGYDAESVREKWWQRLTSMIGLGIKILLAIPFNLHRTRDIGETLRRRLGGNK